MNREQITRQDFPSEGGGYERVSVDAHLAAVAAWTAALEAQINALEVERDTLRNQRPAETGEIDEPADANSLEDPSGVPARPGDETAEPVAPEPETAPEPASEGPESMDPVDDEISAKLTATRLALEGAGRDQIRERLDEAYRLENPEALIDDVLERLD